MSYLYRETASTQLPFSCSNLTIESVEKGVKIYSKLTIKTSERRH